MKIIKKLCIIILGAVVMLMGIFYCITSGKSTFDDTYTSVIQRKFNLLTRTNTKKIIIVGGSSAGFGIDVPYLEENTGYKVVNMGLHAGFGNLLNTEIIKANVNEGDIVLLAYEYTLNKDCFDELGDLELIMEGIDNYTNIYKYLPVNTYKSIIGNLFSYAKKKYTYVPASSGVYSSQAFDENGNMIYKRDGYCIEDYKNNIDKYNQVTTENLNITNRNIKYLKNLKKWIKNKGATVYFSAPPILKDSIHISKNDLKRYKSQIEQTGVELISNPEEYIFDSQYMYDTIYHCNTKGERKRTELLYKDLKPFLKK